MIHDYTLYFNQSIHQFRNFLLLSNNQIGHSCTHACAYCNVSTRGEHAFSSTVPTETRTMGTLKRDYANFIDPGKGQSKLENAKDYNNVVHSPLINAMDHKKVCIVYSIESILMQI